MLELIGIGTLIVLGVTMLSIFGRAHARQRVEKNLWMDEPAQRQVLKAAIAVIETKIGRRVPIELYTLVASGVAAMGDQWAIDVMSKKIPFDTALDQLAKQNELLASGTHPMANELAAARAKYAPGSAPKTIYKQPK